MIAWKRPALNDSPRRGIIARVSDRRRAEPWANAVTVGVVLIFLGMVTASTHTPARSDPRAADHARQAARAGLEYARVALSWDPAWRQGPASSGLLQLYTDGPFRLAFAVSSTPLGGHPARYQVKATGMVANFLLPTGIYDNVRGAGGEGIRFFPYNAVQAVVNDTAEAEAAVDPRTGFPQARWIAPPQLDGSATPPGPPTAPPPPAPPSPGSPP